MYDHIGLRVDDLEASIRFYRAALGGLGYELGSSDNSSAGFMAEDGSSLWLYAGGGTGTAHIAFRAPNRKAVDRFHREALKVGGSNNGAPGVRSDYSPSYYAAFMTDPDGNNIEAVCTS